MRKIIIPLLTTVLIVGVMVFQAKTVDPVLMDAPTARLGDIDGYSSEVLPVSDAEKHTLPEDTIIDKRLYTDEYGTWHQVSLVIGGKSKSSIHRPELCLPSQGFQMSSPRTIDVAGIDWHMVTLTKGNFGKHGFAYTFFNQDGFKTSSHIARIFRDVWDRSIHGRINRWAMMTVNSSFSDDIRLAVFLNKLKGVIAK